MQVQTALGSILRDPKAKEMACRVLGSFSWSGKAVDELEKRLKVQDDVGPMSTFGNCMQVQTALGAILRDPKAKEMPCGVFGSFGWSGEAVDELEKRLTVRGCLLCLRNYTHAQRTSAAEHSMHIGAAFVSAFIRTYHCSSRVLGDTSM